MNKEIILNEEQKEALKQIKVFLESKDLRIFILKGYAGTGKTTLLNELKNKFNDKYNFNFSATTGAASKILKNKINSEVKTVHSNNYTYDKMTKTEKDEYIFEFKQNKKSDISKMTVYVIDEASMLGNNNINKESRVIFGTNKLLQDLINNNIKNKIIFVGDPLQLPPVGSDISVALNKNELEKTFNITCKEFVLTKIMRQEKENTIQNESIKLRKAFDNKEKYDLEKDNKNILEINYDDIPEFYFRNKNNTGIITYSNRSALILSNKIRERLFNNIEEKINVGEKLLVIFNNQKLQIMNGNFIKIVEVINRFSKEIKLNIEKNEEKIIKLEFAEVKIEKENKEIIKTNILLNFLNDFLYPRDEKFISDALSKDAIDRGIEPYNSELYNALRVRYGYVITCHKSQGNEFDNVILENKQIEKDSDYKWLYTGITRAKKYVYLFKEFQNGCNKMLIDTEERNESIIKNECKKNANTDIREVFNIKRKKYIDYPIIEILNTEKRNKRKKYIDYPIIDVVK